MKVYKFDVGIFSYDYIYVLAHSEDEACKIVSEHRGRETKSNRIEKVYDTPQVVVREEYVE